MTMGEDYANEWEISSEEMEKRSIYRDIIKNNPVKNLNTLELGCSTGNMSRELWMDNPESLFCIEHSEEMLIKATKTLEKAGIPVNYLDCGQTNKYFYGEVLLDLKTDKSAVNLIHADYTNYLNMMTACKDNYFDIAFLTFTGGLNQTGSDTYGQLVPTLYAVHPLLKEDGKFIYIDRVFRRKNKDICLHLEIPQEYKLIDTQTDEDIAKFKATYHGTSSITFNRNGKTETTNAPGLKTGELAEIFCDELQKQGFTPSITTYIFQKI